MTAVLLLALLAVPAAAAPRSVDLSEQFETGLRDQGKIGACHAFASVGLLEAALKRGELGEETLSSADLFVRVALKNNAYAIEYLDDGAMKVVQKETGKPDEDLEFALENGVARNATAPWGVFVDSYAAYLKERLEECSRLSKAAKSKSCRYDSFKEYIERLEKDAEGREKKLLGDSKALATDRKEILKKFKGLTLHSKRRGPLRSFTDASIDDIKDPEVCREKGSGQTDALVETLAAGLPAVVCFNMDNLPDWDRDKDRKSKASHCVTAYGYVTKGEGSKARKSFRLRNSWGGVVIRANTPPGAAPQPPQTCPVTYDIDEDHACAIHGMYWLDP